MELVEGHLVISYFIQNNTRKVKKVRCSLLRDQHINAFQLFISDWTEKLEKNQEIKLMELVERIKLQIVTVTKAKNSQSL